MGPFSDYVVYVDESGDHNLAKFDPTFPVFVLTFCIFRKSDYVGQIVPALQRIKFKHFGHDMVVFHEREIHKALPPFTFLIDAARRSVFMTDLNEWVSSSPFVMIAAAIRKPEFIQRHGPDGTNPYTVAMRLGLERVAKHLERRETKDRTVHFVFEARGKKEDAELELEFRRVCDGSNYRGERFPFEIIFAGKQAHSTGLQLADLTARPIGRKVIKPDQPNRAYDTLAAKLDRHPTRGTIDGYGLKTYP